MIPQIKTVVGAVCQVSAVPRRLNFTTKGRAHVKLVTSKSTTWTQANFRLTDRLYLSLRNLNTCSYRPSPTFLRHVKSLCMEKHNGSNASFTNSQNAYSLRKIYSNLSRLSLLDLNQCDEISPKILKTVKYSLPYWIPSILNQNVLTLGLYTNLEDPFELGFQWIFYTPLGSFVENVLRKNLQCKEFHNLFKVLFLQFQVPYGNFFNKHRPILQSELGLTRLFYAKTTLIRIIRLLVEIYQPTLSIYLKEKKKSYFFTKKVLELTLQSGSYLYINALLKPLHLVNADHNGLESISVNLADQQIILLTSPLLAQPGGIFTPGNNSNSVIAVRGALLSEAPISVLYSPRALFWKIFLLGSIFSTLLLKNGAPHTPISFIPSHKKILMGYCINPSVHTTSARFACIGLARGSSLPLAALSMQARPHLLQSRKTTVKVNAQGSFQVTPSAQQYKAVCVYAPNIPAPSASYEKGTVHAFVQDSSKDRSDFRSKIIPLELEYQWEKIAKGEIVVDKLNIRVKKTGQSLMSYLLNTTSLGKESEHRPGVITRDLDVPVFMLGVEGTEPVEISGCTSYNEASKCNEILKTCLSESLTFIKNTQYSSNIRVSPTHLKFSKTQAAHFVPNKMDKIMNRTHEYECTNITNSIFNGMSTYDSLEVSATDYQSLTVQELLVKNLEKGRESTEIELSKLYRQGKDIHRLALSVMADLAYETYYEGRVMLAERYCEDLAFDLGIANLVETKPKIESLLPTFCSKFFLYHTLIDHCKNNLEIMRDHTKKFLALAQTDLTYCKKNKGFVYHDLVQQIKLTEKGEVQLVSQNPLKKLVSEYDRTAKEYTGAIQSMQAMMRFGFLNIMAFASVAEIPPAQIEEFVHQLFTNSFCMVSPLDKVPFDASLLENVNLEAVQRFYDSIKNYGSHISNMFAGLALDLGDIKTSLTRHKQKLQTWLRDESTIKELIDKGKMTSDDVKKLQEYSKLLEAVYRDVSSLSKNIQEDGILARFTKNEFSQIRNEKASNSLTEKHNDLLKAKEMALLLQDYPRIYADIQSFLQEETQDVLTKKVNEDFKRMLEGSYARESYNDAKRVLTEGLKTSSIYSISSKKNEPALEAYQKDLHQISIIQQITHSRNLRQESVPAVSLLPDDLSAHPSPEPTRQRAISAVENPAKLKKKLKKYSY